MKRPIDHHLRHWAYKNARTLIFLSIMFFVTWILIAYFTWHFSN